MISIHAGQCGMCSHFGESHPDHPELISIRTKQEAREDFVDECGHPEHAPLNLKVTAPSSCAGFSPAQIPAPTGS